MRRITPEEAKHFLDSDGGYIYLDVRTIHEFDAGHVPGAKNVPVLEPDTTGRMQPNPRFVEIVERNFSKDSNIITGCKMGGRSMKAAQMLESAGFTSVVDMRGGFQGEVDEFGRLSFPGWAPRGLPVTTDAAADDRYETLASKAAKRTA